MNIKIQNKILNTKNYYVYLKDNSMFIKNLNRSVNNYKLFDEYIKNKYTLKLSDRLNKALDSVEDIYNVLSMLK